MAIAVAIVALIWVAGAIAIIWMAMRQRRLEKAWRAKMRQEIARRNADFCMVVGRPRLMVLRGGR
ncbi:MAG: hypothetical protein EPN91_01020 [Salinibacterium sp.]|nr:MAG: hypothetical protein EPN91_01020 [Salinibacterium sp.]